MARKPAPISILKPEAIVSILRQFGLRTAFSDNLITGFAGDTPVVSFTPSIVSFVQEEIDMDMDKTPITVLKTRLKKYADRPKVSNEAAVKAVTALPKKSTNLITEHTFDTLNPQSAALLKLYGMLSARRHELDWQQVHDIFIALGLPQEFL